MFYMFHLDVAMTIQVCFNSILHMLRRSDGCCRGDETLGHGKGRAPRQSAVEDGGTAEMASRRGEERGVTGDERGGLDAGGVTGMGIESRMVGCGHWRGIDCGQPDAIHWRGI